MVHLITYDDFLSFMKSSIGIIGKNRHDLLYEYYRNFHKNFHSVQEYHAFNNSQKLADYVERLVMGLTVLSRIERPDKVNIVNYLTPQMVLNSIGIIDHIDRYEIAKERYSHDSKLEDIKDYFIEKIRFEFDGDNVESIDVYDLFGRKSIEENPEYFGKKIIFISRYYIDKDNTLKLLEREGL